MSEQIPMSIVDLESNVSPTILSYIIGVNVSQLYTDAKLGRLPDPMKDHTYIQCLQQYINHFKKNQEVKLRELEEKQRAKDARALAKGKITIDSDGQLNPLVEAKMRQDIRNAMAQEAKTWLEIAIKKRDLVASTELVRLMEPFLLAIRNNFLAIASEHPEAQLHVDSAMDSLAELGRIVLEKAQQDENDFVQHMLEKELDIEDITLELTTGD